MNNQLLASDNFISGSLAAGWAAMYGLSEGTVISGSPNVVEPGATGANYGQIWTGFTWPDDQSSEVTTNTVKDSGTYTILNVRWQTGSASGYQANLYNGAAYLYVVTSGSSVQLGSTVTGLTFSAGDVWCLQAAGACISLYQNWNRVAYWYDATYTSGSPGFQQYVTTTTSNTKVLSWRGYSAVQQDGIWQKQGIVIAANATDLTPFGSEVFGAFQNTAILYEGNAQLLSGTVYKTWFTSGVDANIYYAESLDGINWTRSLSPVISGWSNPAIIKVGSVYYLYAQVKFPGTIYLFTSTDGINWAKYGSPTPMLSEGSAGSWDETGLFLLVPVAIISGTWYGLYTGASVSSPSLYSIGLATSPDGKAWTKYAGNPVLTNVTSSQAIVNVNGTWYAWFYSNQPGQGNPIAPYQDPLTHPPEYSAGVTARVGMPRTGLQKQRPNRQTERLTPSSSEPIPSQPIQKQRSKTTSLAKLN